MSHEIAIKDETTFLMNYYETHWNIHGTLPNPIKVAQETGIEPGVVQRVTNDIHFRTKLQARGLPFAQKNCLTTEEFRIIATVTNPEIKGGLAARLKACGVSQAMYRNMLVRPEFKEAVESYANYILTASVADVNEALVGQARKGDMQAIKFFYEITGRWDPNKSSTQDAMKLVQGILQIIQEEVRDPEVLERMARRIRSVAATNGMT